MFLVIGLSFQINIGRNDILIKNCRLKSEKSKRFKYSSQYEFSHWQFSNRKTQATRQLIWAILRS